MLESDLGGEISQEQWIVAHFSGRSAKHQSPTIQYIGLCGDAQRQLHMLLDQNDAEFRRELAQALFDLFDDADPDPLGRFIE